MEQLTRETIERIRRIANKDAVEWAILYLMAKNNGTISNLELRDRTDRDLAELMKPPRLSQTKKALEQEIGIKAVVSFGTHYTMTGKLLNGYQLIFAGIEQVLEAQEELKIQDGYKAFKSQKRKGKI